jgi:hypothetical protein
MKSNSNTLSREAEGTGPMTLGNLPLMQGAKSGEMTAILEDKGYTVFSRVFPLREDFSR